MNKFFFSSFLMLFFMGIMQGQELLNLKIGSYNIRYDNKWDREAGNDWDDRLPVIASIIEWEDVDVFGAQEVLVSQLKDMEMALPDYGFYGVGRDDGLEEGEFAPVFYKKDKFKLQDSGNIWLSETPDRPSKGWDAALPRICTWVKLEEKQSGKQFWFFNLHMDHVGVVARAESSKLVVEKIAEIAKSGTVFFTGDFNVDQHNEIYTILEDSPGLSDSYNIAKHKMAWNGTFNAFDTNLWTDSRIDHIFVSNDVAVTHYAVLLETYRSTLSDEEIKKGDFPEELSSKPARLRLPSDHYPIFVRINVPLK